MTTGDTVTRQRRGDARARSRTTRLAEELPGLVLLAVGLALAGLALWRLDGAMPDDAWITFRYARNLAEGHGWTYNPGQSVAGGATSALYVLLLASAALTGIPIPIAANIIFVAGLGMTAYLTARAMRGLGFPVGAVAVIPLITLHPLIVPTRGMESALFLACVGGAFLLAVERRWLWAGVLAALCVTVRGDGALVGIALAVWSMTERKQLPLDYASGAAMVLTPFLVLMFVMTGSIVPGTLDAKVAQGASGYWPAGTRFLRHWMNHLSGSGLVLSLYTLTVVGLSTLGGWHAAARSRSSRWFLGTLLSVVAVFIVTYGVILDVPGYPWYYALPWFAATVLASLGIDLIVTRPPRLPVVVASALIIALTAGGASATSSGIKTTYRSYWQIGEWLRTHSAPDASVAASEIGIIGWSSERTMVDYLGLLDPQSREELRRKDLVSWMERQEPDYWVRFDPPIRVEEQATEAPWFPFAFRHAYEAGRLDVFRRVRTIQTAKSSYDQALERDAKVVADALSERGLEPPDPEAAALLAHIIASRSDVRDGTIQDGHVSIGDVAAWAMRHGHKVEELADTIDKWGHWYRAIAQETDGDPLTVPVTVLEVLQRRDQVRD